MTPGSTLVRANATLLIMRFTVAETIESFTAAKQDTFRTLLSTALECYSPDCLIELVVSAASVTVEARITIPHQATSNTTAVTAAATARKHA